MVCVQVTSYKTIHALTQEAHHAAEGTLAYVSEKGGELYIRARNGWHKIQVCRTRPERFNIFQDIISSIRSSSAASSCEASTFKSLSKRIDLSSCTVEFHHTSQTCANSNIIVSFKLLLAV